MPTRPRWIRPLALAAVLALSPAAHAGPNDPLNDVSGTEDWDREDAAKRAKAGKKDDVKEQLRDYDQTKRRSSADREEIKQERIIFKAVTGGLPPAPAGYSTVPATPGRQEDWMKSEADSLEGRYRAPAPAAPPPPPPPPPKPANAWPDEAPVITPSPPSSIQVIKSQPPPAPAAPPKPKAPPPPPPRKEETAEDILKKQKGHFDESSGQFVDDELPEATGKKKK
jgi:hypothetical protein